VCTFRKRIGERTKSDYPEWKECAAHCFVGTLLFLFPLFCFVLFCSVRLRPCFFAPKQQILISNVHKVKLSTPDYKDMEERAAVADFLARRANYEKYYQPVDEEDGAFCKIVNSHRYVVHNIRGYLSLKVVHFVMNLHTLPRTFYLTRHGQSEYNLLGKIGGDSGLTPAGIEYARRLAIFAKEEIARPRPEDQAHNGEVARAIGGNSKDVKDANRTNEERPCRLWTSTLRRTQETAQFIEHSQFNHTFDNGETMEWLQFRKKPRRNLDELYAGTCDGMTYKEIQEVFPEEFSRRQSDKLSYRYPRGESYMDVTLRLEPLAQEMERIREPLLIVGHQGILRILYAYFMGLDRKEAPYVSIPLNNVIELTPHAYGCHEKRYCLMMKEEMLADGQDEPVTSMPVADKHQPLTNMPDVKDRSQLLKGLKGRGSVQELDAKYAEDDAIMNAPSC